MSSPRTSKRLRYIRLGCMKRRKVFQETVATSPSSRHRQHATTPAKTDSVASSIETQTTVTVDMLDLQSDEPSRKRDNVPQWLEKQKQRLERLKKELLAHRDSMFGEDWEGKLHRASQEANAIVLGPHGEYVPQAVINIFFERHPAGRSDWRNSVLWERHLDDFFARKGLFAPEALKQSIYDVLWQEHLASGARSPSPSTSSRSSDERDSHFFIPTSWSGSSKRKQDRGKSPAPDEPDEIYSSPIDNKPLSPRTQSPAAKKKLGIQIRDHTDRVVQHQPSFIRCASVSKPVDSSLIQKPPVPDLKPASSEGFDPSNLAHCTGRPYKDCAPIETLDFPLAAPSTPQLRPKRRFTPIPPIEELDFIETVQFKESPILSADPSATTVQRWPSQTLQVPRNGARFTADDDTIVDNHSRNGLSMPRVKECLSSAARPVRLRSAHHKPAPAPAVRAPPTPPESRHNSNASQSLSDIIYGATEPYLAESTTPDGPADRDWATCTLSDTTGSSLPDCPIFVSRAEQKQRLADWWAGYAERHGPGMRNWR